MTNEHLENNNDEKEVEKVEDEVTQEEVDNTGTSDDNSAWVSRVTAFAEAADTTFEAVSDALIPLVGQPGKKALEILNNPAASPFEDLRRCLVESESGPKIPLGILRQYEDILRGSPEALAAKMGETNMFAILPEVPEQDTYIASLKSGGELKTDVVTIIAGFNAFTASHFGLYNVPDKIVRAMEDYASLIEEPCEELFYKIHRQITRRDNAAIMAAMNISGNFASQKRKNEFLSRFGHVLMPAVQGFQDCLNDWKDSWNSGMDTLSMLTALVMSDKGAALPAGLMAPPPIDVILDEVEAVVSAINQTYAGTGIPIARAMAYDAEKIKEILEFEGLPQLVGATNKDQMLKSLGIQVSASDVRLTRNLALYTNAVLSLSEFAKSSPKETTMRYLPALIVLGKSIPWESLDD